MWMLRLKVSQLAHLRHLRQSCQFDYVHLEEAHVVDSFSLASDSGEELTVGMFGVERGRREEGCGPSMCMTRSSSHHVV